MNRKWLAFFLAAINSVSFAAAADPLKSLSQQLKDELSAQTVPVLAVLNFTYSKGRVSTGSHLVSERLLTYFVQNGMPMAERRLIPQILEEKRWEEVGVVRPDSMKKIGNVLGVEAVVVGSLADDQDGTTKVMARIIEVKSAKILAAATTSLQRLWHDSPRSPGNNLMRSAVPADYSSLGMTPAETDENRGRFKLSNFEPKRRKQRYYPAPVPVLILSTPQRVSGGSSQ